MLKLIMVDMDGTLFDTREVNYLAYRDAMGIWGYKLDHDYYCEFCNGRHYLDFLPTIITNDRRRLDEIHEKKMQLYHNYLPFARPNNALIGLLLACRQSCKIALVTTASNNNVYEILKKFEIEQVFDLILTGDDVKTAKPNPEGYLKAMKYFGLTAKECVIFEDSEIGFCAARQAGINFFAVKEFV